MKVLVACEFSGIVREAFRKRGHDAWSCDLLPTEILGNHIQDDVIIHIQGNSEGWDLMIAHPPCTFLANSGVQWLHVSKTRWRDMLLACAFFNKLKNCAIPKIAIENPIPHKYARRHIGEYTQLIQPWQFGHGETKATCLWLKNLPPLKPTKIVEGREGRVWKEAPNPERWKNRSRTYLGIAEAMAEQWG